MVNINEFKNFCEFCSNKVQQGNTTTVSQFNQLANRSQMLVFEKDYQTFLQVGDISEFLKSFLVSRVTQVPSDGVVTLPANLEHISSIRSYYVKPTGGSLEVEADEVKNRDWSSVSSSQLHEPTLRFPKFTRYASTVKILPININVFTLDYLKTPIAPEWNFTTVNSRPVYDAANSINFEFSEFAMNNVAAQYLSLIGVNLKDSELSQFSSMYKQETNSVV